MTDIDITVSPDGLRAFLYLSENILEFFPSFEELRSLCAERGIVFGLNEPKIRDVAENKTCNVKVEIATGMAAVQPVAGKIEILVDVSSRGRPKVLSGGNVDHRDIGYIVNVRKNAPIMRLTPPIPGTDGATVLGKAIPCAMPPVLKVIAGAGTRFLEEDPNVLVADKDGAVAIFPNGKAMVLDEKIIPGDIDYTTGNVTFLGNLFIKGSVRGGFSVEAAGNVTIAGNIEDALVKCGGNLIVSGGASGSGHGRIECEGTCSMKHCQNFSVSTVSLIVVEDIVHCSIWAENSLRAKSVVGGTVSAGKSINVEAVGTSAEPRTVIDLGGMSVLLKQKYELLKDLASTTTETGNVKTAMYSLVKDEMDTSGELARGSLARLEELKKNGAQCVEKITVLQGTLERLDEKLKMLSIPEMRARTIYPNTVVKAGPLEKIIKELLVGSVVSLSQNAITISRA